MHVVIDAVRRCVVPTVMHCCFRFHFVKRLTKTNHVSSVQLRCSVYTRLSDGRVIVKSEIEQYTLCAINCAWPRPRRTQSELTAWRLINKSIKTRCLANQLEICVNNCADRHSDVAERVHCRLRCVGDVQQFQFLADRTLLMVELMVRVVVCLCLRL